jgi:hypothetical protein
LMPASAQTAAPVGGLDRVVIRRYETVGENRAMFVSNSIPSNRDYVEQ